MTAAGPPYVFTDDEDEPARRRPGMSRFARDLTSVLLIVLGVVGVIGTVYAMDALAGVLVTFVGVIALGVLLGTNRGG